jgi:ribonucleotide reductase alpha subunit
MPTVVFIGTRCLLKGHLSFHTAIVHNSGRIKKGADKNTAIIQKASGGTGFDFSALRPTGDLVASSGATTSGPISIWHVIAETTNAIQQGAFRRGANVGMMDIVVFGRRIIKVIQDFAHKTSEKLAKERGCFPNWKWSIWDVNHHRPMRNASGITAPPTARPSGTVDSSTRSLGSVRLGLRCI